MKKMVPVAIFILIIAVVTMAILNKDYVKDKDIMIENFSFVLMNNGEEVAIVDLEFIEGLEAKEFKANLKSSGKDPVEHSFRGVALKDIIESKEESLEGKKQVVIRSIDGFAVALSAAEVAEEDNVYIVYEIDGKPLGTKDDGGSGPYQIVIRKDAFGQRWAKFVVEVELK